MIKRPILSLLALYVWLIIPLSKSVAVVKEFPGKIVEITIYRDQWGVPHIFGPTDASVIFGAAYAQAEDNWQQVEDNFIRAIGRSAEIYGKEALLDDFLTRALEIPRRSQEEYNKASEQLQTLYAAYAAGFNYFLQKHPEIEPRIFKQVQPWYTLALIRFKYHHNEFLGYAGLKKKQSKRALKRTSLGVTGKNQSRLNYSASELHSLVWPDNTTSPNGEPVFGSNQWAVAGSRTANGYPMLLINPHVSFFGLSTYTEIHLHSREGLIFSGLTRFGFMLPYMGNNACLGWAYTDNYGDHGDLYLETFNADTTGYQYDSSWRPLISWTETINVLTENGLEPYKYRFSKTHHGPVLGYTEDDQPLAVRLAKLDEGGWFEQWYGMMRAGSLREWRKSAALLNVPYMNTMYADCEGNILYIYNHAIPRRSLEYNWSWPVQGNDPETEWQGYHTLDELPQFLNPVSGYLQNTNSTPFTATDGITVGPQDFPAYMIGGETDNRRARNSRRILRKLNDLTLEDFAQAVLNTRLTAADEWLGDLFTAYDSLSSIDPVRSDSVAGPIESLRSWDTIAAKHSVPTTLFVLWSKTINPDRIQDTDQWLRALVQVSNRLEEDWSTWEVPWGEINRIQRPDAAGLLPFDDTLSSLPVAGAPGWLGSIFTFHSRPAEGGKRCYGVHGNSFVKVIEFTPEVQARSVFVFGQSGDPSSPHYFDQAELYSAQRFKPAWFSEEEVKFHAEQIYTLPFAVKTKRD